MTINRPCFHASRFTVAMAVLTVSILVLLIALCAVRIAEVDGRDAAALGQQAELLGGSEGAVVEADSFREEDGLMPNPADSLSEDGGSTLQDASSDDGGKRLRVRLTFDDGEVTALLDDTATAAALVAQLPLTVDMSDANNNEKFVYLNQALPVNPYVPDRIAAGDLLLFGDSCVVLFYEPLASSYGYTRLGRVEDPAALSFLAHAGSVRATLEAA